MNLDKDTLEIVGRGDAEFSSRQSILTLWQELALNFYPQRANFTSDMTLGEEYASHLTSSYPVNVMRTLQTAVPAMLRPKDVDWVTITTDNEDDDMDAKAWLQRATYIQRRFMYRADSSFIRCMSEVDSDFLCFGNSACYVTENKNRDGLLYQSVSLKDIVWFEDEAGKVCEVHRSMNLTAQQAVKWFGEKNVHEKIKECLTKQSRKVFTFRHIVMKAEYYHGFAKDIAKKGFPYVSLWVDVENKHIVEKVGSYNMRYVISRWQTVSGFKYGYSPASQIALPDARLHQKMMLTMLEVAEKSADPPMVATDDVVRSDVNAYSGGITWIDRDYDERLGQALRPLSIDRNGLSYAIQMMDMIKGSLSEGLYENRLSLPPAGADMTATEIMQRVKEYARTALPLFAPIEEEVNAQVCDITFEILMRNGGFGSVQDIPDSLQGQDVKFKFMSPLNESRSELIKQHYMEALNIYGATMQTDPNAVIAFDTAKAFEDTLKKSDMPAEWIRSQDDIAELQAQSQEKQEIQEMAQIAGEVGSAGQSVQGLIGGLGG